MITVDWLKENDGYPHYSGLGAIKCRLKYNRAYHFYSDHSPTLVNRIHDHRFGFTSTIIKGKLENTIYEIDGQNPESILQVERGECKRGAEQKIIMPNANVKKLVSFTTGIGESYHIEYDTLHQINQMTPAVITYLMKEPVSQLEPRLVIDTSIPRVCSWPPKTQKECWEIIEYTLAL